MHIDNKIHFSRELSLDRTRLSAFLLGPRLTGKTYMLLQLNHAAYFNLLDPEAELRYRAQPRFFWEEVRSLPEGSTIIVDEVQRVPSLLDYVQMGIEDKGH